MTSQEVKEFYDGFLNSRMLDYRLQGGNPRLQKAIHRVASLIRPGETMLDLGCGIGLVAESVSAALDHSVTVFGCDTSPRNIWYAQQTIVRPNLHFFEADIINEFSKVAETVKGVDVVTVIDVIEHIPVSEHPALFQNIAKLTRPGARIVLTYPSPQYQRYLKKEQPEELQIIDQIVEVAELNEILNPLGFTQKHYSLEDVVMENQYVHAVFQRDLRMQRVTAAPDGKPIDRIRRRISCIFQERVAYRYRKWKYVDRIFSRS